MMTVGIDYLLDASRSIVEAHEKCGSVSEFGRRADADLLLDVLGAAYRWVLINSPPIEKEGVS